MKYLKNFAKPWKRNGWQVVSDCIKTCNTLYSFFEIAEVGVRDHVTSAEFGRYNYISDAS